MGGGGGVGDISTIEELQNTGEYTDNPNPKAKTGKPKPLNPLGGSWVVISGVTGLLLWVITIVTLLITPLITTHPHRT